MPNLRAGFLLQRRRHERGRGFRWLARLCLDAGDGQIAACCGFATAIRPAFRWSDQSGPILPAIVTSPPALEFPAQRGVADQRLSRLQYSRLTEGFDFPFAARQSAASDRLTRGPADFAGRAVCAKKQATG